MARDLFRAHAQLRAAAAQLSDEEVAAAISADGSAETEVASDSAGLEISTADAAMRLGLTRERVCQLLNAGDLLGRKSGKAWRVHAPSVDDLIESRRAA
ncbi:helix-turn-helix domain-containing protein [Kribbella rubisoli]|uniref:helix-turn-helix domain-containing protein n=1 Tax=Kribbella rubisoli TaxID=3075929 RepID=UPI00102B2CFC|nr:helix-turn-helix domain-containing protein [Kribbella rubisoli]